jgi:hypothetical protein
MSHLTTITIEFKDLGAVKVACTELGLELVENQTTFKYYYPSAPCDHAIRIPRNTTAYEVGLVATQDGYELKYDTYQNGHGMMEKIGQDANKLKQAYATEIARKTMAKQGYRVNTIRQNGRVRLVCTK